MRIKNKRVLKNGAIAGYVYYESEKKWKWRIIGGPKKGGDSLINNNLINNSNYLIVDNLNNIILSFYKNSNYDYRLDNNTIILEDNTKYKQEIEDFGMFSKIFFESLLQSEDRNTIFNSSVIKSKYDNYIKRTQEIGNVFKKKRNMYHDILVSFYLYTTGLYRIINPFVRKYLDIEHFKFDKSTLIYIIDKILNIPKDFSRVNKEKYMKRIYTSGENEKQQGIGHTKIFKSMKNSTNRKNQLLRTLNRNKYSIFDIIFFMYLGYYLVASSFQQLIPSNDIFLYRASGDSSYKKYKRSINTNRSQVSNSTVLSTTIDPGITCDFLEGQYKVLEIIKVTKRTIPIILLESITEYEDENEILLQFSMKRNVIAVNNYKDSLYKLKISNILFSDECNPSKIYFSIINPY